MDRTPFRLLLIEISPLKKCLRIVLHYNVRTLSESTFLFNASVSPTDSSLVASATDPPLRAALPLALLGTAPVLRPTEEVDSDIDGENVKTASK